MVDLSLTKAALAIIITATMIFFAMDVPGVADAAKLKPGEELCESCYLTNWKVNLRNGARNDSRVIAVIPKSNFVMCFKRKEVEKKQVWLYVEWLTRKGRIRKGYIKYSDKALSLVDCPM